LKRPAFTLLELLLALTIIALLMALLLPAVAAVRDHAADAQCKHHLKVLGQGVLTYAAQHRGLFPPVADWRNEPVRYWWGVNAAKPDFKQGLIYRHLGYLAGTERSLFECPAQPWGSYQPQGAAGEPTTTYGYNGYYLCPAGTPGWAQSIGHRPWRSIYTVQNPDQVFMLADTLMNWGNGYVTNNCLLDPPWTWQRRRWRLNPFTTLCFRHCGRANVCFANGAVDSVEPTTIIDPDHMIGYVGDSNAPHYVPDWKDW